MSVSAIQSDITKLRFVDAIVSADNGIGVAGRGVAGAICRAAGPEYAKENRAAAEAAGWYREGAVYVTSAGKLSAQGIKSVIHAVTMDMPGGPTSYSTVDQCLRGIFQACYKHGYKAIAIPGLGTGIGNLDPALVARSTVEAALRHPEIETLVIDVMPAFIEAADKAIAELAPGQRTTLLA